MTTHKTLRGPRGGLIMCKERFAQALDAKIFPGMQGGPLMHIIAAKAVALKEALSDDFKAVPGPDREKRAEPSPRRCWRPASASSRAARTTT